MWGDNDDDDDSDNSNVLSVCGSVHTIWCDSVGFNDKLLFLCSSEAFSSMTNGFEWDDSESVSEWLGLLKCSATPDFSC